MHTPTMRHTLLAAALLAAFTLSPTAQAGKVSPRPDVGPAGPRIQQLKPLPGPLRAPRPAEPPAPSEAAEPAPAASLFGEMQVRVGEPRPVVGTPDDVRANVWLGLELNLAETARLSVSGIYQQQVTDPPELDEAYLSFGQLGETGVQVDLGRLYAPFGTYATDMINDPLTLFLGETKGDGVMLQLKGETATLQTFLYDDPRPRGSDPLWAVRASASLPMGTEDDERLDVALSYTSDLAAAGSFQDALSTARPSPAGIGLLIQWRNAQWRIAGEYVGSVSAFRPGQLTWRGQGAQPQATHFEVAHMTGPWTLAFAAQWSEQAAGLGLPKARQSVSVQYRLTDSITLAFEAGQEEDYGRADGGTGRTDGYALAQLSLSF